MKLASIVLVLAGLAGVGCGSRGGVASDGGADADSHVTGRRSFDVVATLAVMDGGIGLSNGLPVTNSFTLVLDTDAQQAIVGGKGHAATVAATTGDGRTFHLGAFSAGASTAGACAGATSIDYKTLDITVSGTGLQGKATGSAQISCGDCFFNVGFTADVSGVPDKTMPSLLPSGAVTIDPFATLVFVASEPLPATAKARLVSSSGASFDLEPFSPESAPSLITGFGKPNVVLPPADGYVVTLDGLIDFAGNGGASNAPLRLSGFATPPLVPPDGFESATGTDVGGALVLGPGAPLAAISGMHSVYFGGSGAPTIPGAKFGPSLRVRLAVTPGATKVRFSYRTVSTLVGPPAAMVNVGSVGHAPVASETISATTGSVQTDWPAAGKVAVGTVASMEIPLPAEVTDEVVVSIDSLSLGCGPSLPPAGLQVDDLRVE